jgi:kinesin family protein 6/9
MQYSGSTVAARYKALVYLVHSSAGNDCAALLPCLQLKRTSKERAVSINGIKRKLDDQTQQAQQLQTKRLQEAGDPGSAAAAEPEQDSSSSSSSAAVMGPEELAAVQRVQQLKAQYRDQYNELQMLKSEVAYTQQLVDQCSQQLLMGFDEW